MDNPFILNMLFQDIPFPKQIVSRLSNALEQQKLASSLLLLSHEGGLALPLGLSLAARLVCKDPTGFYACGLCTACSKSKKYVHPDIHFVFPTTSDTKGDIQESPEILKLWRQMLQVHPFPDLDTWMMMQKSSNKQLFIGIKEAKGISEAVSYSSSEGQNRIILIWLPELMRQEAANALLKKLEEPNKNTYFILACHDEEKLLATIISRLQPIALPPLKTDQISAYLQKDQGLAEEKANQAAMLAMGSMASAYSFLTETENDHFEEFTQWMRACFSLGKNLDQFKVLVISGQNFANKGREGQKSYIRYVLSMLQTISSALISEEHLASMTAQKDFILNFGKTLAQNDRFYRLYSLFNDAIVDLERNVNGDLVFTDTSLKIASILRS